MVPAERIENRIFQIRGKKVLLDRDLAELYEVSRNINRFPEDFMFRLTNEEKRKLVTNWHRFSSLKYSSSLPCAFTEQGVAMLSSVLNSERAIRVNIQIMRAFVSLRRIGLTYIGLKRRIEAMEKRYDAQFKIVFEAIKKLLEPQPVEKKRRIDFHLE